MSAEALGQVWVSCADLTPAQTVVALAVADVVNDAHDNEFWMASGPLGRKVGMHPRHVRERLRELVELGWLELRRYEPGQPVRYAWVDRGGPPQVDRDGPPVDSESPTPSSSSNSKKLKSARATRIPIPFDVTDDMAEWAEREIPGFDWERETPKFVDHFRSTGGANGAKRDWPAAWRNWMRREQQGAFR